MTDVGLLDSDAGLQALAPEWVDLWRRVPVTTPFASPAWLLPWWRQFGTGAPRVAIQREQGRLVAVLPLYQLNEPGIRKLLPIGAGTSDHLDALLEPGVAVGPLLQAALDRGRADGVDACDLIEVPPASVLHGIKPAGWSMHWTPSEPCPVLQLPATVAELGGVVPGNTLRKLRMNRNRAERAGGFTIETTTAATAAGMFTDLVHLHQARWTAQGEAGVLSDPAVERWLRDSIPGLLSEGAIRLQSLRIKGIVAASCCALLAGQDRILFYMSGFDAAYAFVSPGSLLLAAMLEQAIAEGRREANFLRGRESYKYAWGAVDQLTMTCRLTPTPD